MKYLSYRFLFECSDERLQPSKDILMDLSADCGFESFEDENGEYIGYVQESLIDETALNQLIADFPIPDVKISYVKSKVEDQNWNNVWEQQGFEPINIDDKVIVFDAKKKIVNPPQPDSILVGIDAVQAFGTGTHQTTQMMIKMLIDSDIMGKSILDCGCGTGILCLVASKLGAEKVVGFDIDEWSVTNTIHNAEINGVNNVSVLHGDSCVISHISGCFDYVLANINRNILLNDMSKYVEVMTSQSFLIISGFYIEDVPLLLEKAESLKMVEIKRIQQDRWACLILQRQLS